MEKIEECEMRDLGQAVIEIMKEAQIEPTSEEVHLVYPRVQVTGKMYECQVKGQEVMLVAGYEQIGQGRMPGTVFLGIVQGEAIEYILMQPHRIEMDGDFYGSEELFRLKNGLYKAAPELDAPREGPFKIIGPAEELVRTSAGKLVEAFQELYERSKLEEI